MNPITPLPNKTKVITVKNKGIKNEYLYHFRFVPTKDSILVLKLLSRNDLIPLSANARTIFSIGEAEKPIKINPAPEIKTSSGNKIKPNEKLELGKSLFPKKTIKIPTAMSKKPIQALKRVFVSSVRVFLCAKCEGRMINASINEKSKHVIATNAISRIISSPSMKKSTEKATTVVKTEEKTDGKTSIVPSIAAR